MSVIKLSGRYAKSLVDLAVEKNELNAVYNDMRSFQQVCKSSREFVLMLRNPIIHLDKKMNVINQLFSKSFSNFTMSFMTLVVSKGREAFLPEMAEAVISTYNRMNGITEVKLTTAVAASQPIIDKVKSIVATHTGNKEVELQTKVKPALIGGFVMEFDNQMVDASVIRQLEILDDNFLDNSYIKKY